MLAQLKQHHGMQTKEAVQAINDDCGVENGSNQDQELSKLAELMAKHGSWILVNWSGRELSMWYPDELTMKNRHDRLTINDLMYRSAFASHIANLLPQGRYNAADFSLFAGLESPAARAGRGRGGKQ